MKDYKVIFPKVGKYYFMYIMVVENKITYLLVVDEV